jgi:site-specific DNA-methyltransferase (adenine-specific)
MKEYLQTKNGKLYLVDNLEYMKTVPDNSFDLIVTSPPYNFGGFNRDGRKKQYDNYSDNMDNDKYKKWIKTILVECARVLKDGGALYWNHKSKFENHQCKHTFWIIDECPLYFAQHIVWKYPASPDVAKIKWYPRKEDVFYFTKGKPKYFNEDMAKMTDVWNINHQEKNKHPAPFPSSFAERCILASSKEWERVFDPFMGSGTVAKMCEKLNRYWIGCEISKEYCNLTERNVVNEMRQGKLSFA